jgi:hypothetical protein
MGAMEAVELDTGIVSKGSLIRGYIEYLHANGLYQMVYEQVPAETQAIMRNPPTIREWCAVRHPRAIFEVLGTHAGPSAVRKMTRSSLNTSFFNLLRPMIQGLMRLFGGSPRALFSHGDVSLRGVIRGVRFAYRDAGDKEGVMEYHASMPWTPLAAEAWAGSCEAVIDFCGAEGEVAVDGIRQEGGQSILSIRVKWR